MSLHRDCVLVFIQSCLTIEGARLAVFISWCVLLCGVNGAPTDPLYTFLNPQGLEHLVATFKEQDVTNDMLPAPATILQGGP